MDVGVMINDLNQEITKLTAARDALMNVLNGTGSSAAISAVASSPVAAPPAPAPAPAPATRGKKATTSKKRGRPAGTSGQTRADQAFDLVKATPGITIPQIAEAMGIEANYLYRVMPKLTEEKRVRNENGGWYPSVS